MRYISKLVVAIVVVLLLLTQSVIFDEIALTELSVAECSTKNANHSLQVITPFRSLVLCAESRREMEDWIAALKAAASHEYYDVSAINTT